MAIIWFPQGFCMFFGLPRKTAQERSRRARDRPRRPKKPPRGPQEAPKGRPKRAPRGKHH
eukprot:6077891-Pyramimonas_sp.AAC.1